MLYYYLKIAHVMIACCLLAACSWSLLPIYRVWKYVFWWKWVSHFQISFQRMLIVVPLGVLQGALGMSILSVEPSVVPRYEVAGLLACFAVLCLLWLIATGVIKCVALAVRRTHCVSRKEIHRFFQVWIFCLFAVFIVMLFWMVNLIQ